MTADAARAIRLILLGLAVVCAAIIVVATFGDQIDKINWRLVTLLCGFGFAAYMVYEWNTNKQRYNFIDLFMTEGAADLWKHLVVFSFGLFAWAIVQQGLGDKGVSTDLMLGGLGIFVGREGVALLSSAIKNRPAASPSPISVNQAAPQQQPTPEHPLPVQLVGGEKRKGMADSGETGPTDSGGL